MNAALVLQDCIKPYKDWAMDLEKKENIYNSPSKIIKGTAEDFAEIQAVIDAKNKPAFDICGAVGVNRKAEKPPDKMYEVFPNRYHGKRDEEN